MSRYKNRTTKKNNIEGNKKININDYVYLTYIIVVLIILYRNIKKIEYEDRQTSNSVVLSIFALRYVYIDSYHRLNSYTLSVHRRIERE